MKKMPAVTPSRKPRLGGMATPDVNTGEVRIYRKELATKVAAISFAAATATAVPDPVVVPN